ncbi:MAG: alanine--tRNA ligase [Nitrospiraceae bacterium]|nr:alanine--tRNA ligase [Nitrospiraceae bacterium]
MKSTDIRETFLKFFESKGHARVKSSSLIPMDDPTLLFTNAGMVQFKSVFTKEESRPYQRATTSQKCMRAGGKHNDLDNVGVTARHHTFFEMLGNFSFGDYFKEGAITYAWELLTGVFGLPRDELWITVYRDDDEAFDIWKKKIGIPEKRIVRMGEKDNFWAMGDTGPCGPCSEIHIDQGPEVGCRRPECKIGCDCDRFLELWNLVFMQFNRKADGTMVPLPNPSIDTGMGLERISAILQGVQSNYETDLFIPIIQTIADMAGSAYGEDDRKDTALRIISDHSRAAAFLIADGILPSNEGRGYVLRRIMRRGMRFGHFLGFKKPFLYRVADYVIDMMGEIYPELVMHREAIEKMIYGEEDRFSSTLNNGLRLLNESLHDLSERKQTLIPGDVVFKLYDTYGFPVDLAEDIAKEAGMAIDHDGFQKQMTAQRERAQKAWKGSGEKEIPAIYKQVVAASGKVSFTGYDGLFLQTTVSALIKEGRQVTRAEKGETLEVITPRTPFYGESGGQEGDRGLLEGTHVTAEVLDTRKPLPDLIVHRVKILEGTLTVSDEITLTVDGERRGAIARHHSATHLLHAALRQTLGEHVRQAGSLVTEKRLRFDFTHFQAVRPVELTRIEDIVNGKIRENLPVEKAEKDFDTAVNEGALAFFGDKYGDVVRVIKVPGTSTELCGGTHVDRTGDVGAFFIVGEESVAAGIRRIEAVAGQPAVNYARKQRDILDGIAKRLKTPAREAEKKLAVLLDDIKGLEKKIRGMESKIVSGRVSELIDKAKTIGDISLVVSKIPGADPKRLRTMADEIRQRLDRCVVVLGSANGAKAYLIAMVSKDATDRVDASNLIKEISPTIGGQGGGRRDMASAGGKDPENLERALSLVEALIQ